MERRPQTHGDVLDVRFLGCDDVEIVLKFLSRRFADVLDFAVRVDELVGLSDNAVSLNSEAAVFP